MSSRQTIIIIHPEIIICSRQDNTDKLEHGQEDERLNDRYENLEKHAFFLIIVPVSHNHRNGFLSTIGDESGTNNNTVHMIMGINGN